VDTIELRGLTFFGQHGVLPEETRLGQRFVVDVRLGLDLAPAGRHDDLSLTVNYAVVAETVRSIVEGSPFRLIEALAEAVAAAILDGHPRVQQVDVQVAKPSAPITAAPSGLVSVAISRRRADRQAPSSSTSAEGSIPTIQAGGSVLSAQSIRELLEGDPPLVGPLGDPDQQIQPNGVDLTLESVWRMQGAGAIGVANDDRVIPAREALDPSADDWFELTPGTYVIRYREVVALPLDVMAFGRPRSSLLRSGAAIHTAVWDAGYQGRSEALLVVYGEPGVRLARGARVLQLVFVRLDTPTQAYTGAYQGENVSSC
jgi:dUTP pyrophosphatase